MYSVNILDLTRYIVWCLIFAFIFISDFIIICLFIVGFFGFIDFACMIVVGWVLFFSANTLIEGRKI